MTDWGLHIYSNIPSLVNKTSTDRQGFPGASQRTETLKQATKKVPAQLPTVSSDKASCWRFLLVLQNGMKRTLFLPFAKF